MNLERALRAGPPADRRAPWSSLASEAADRGLLDVAFSHHPSPFGDLLVAVTPAGVATVAYSDFDAVLVRLAERVSPRVLESAAPTDELRRQLDEYFDRRRQDFDLALDLSLVGGFRVEVLEHLAAVPYGETTTYADLAAESGRPRAYRAVGSAMATNPVAIVLPCHRVLPSSGGLGNYGGGVETKRRLLELEGVEVG